MDMTQSRAARDALRAYQARTRRGIWALLPALAALTALAIWFKLSFVGVLALLLLFAGATWVARRHLQAHAMRFRTTMR